MSRAPHKFRAILPRSMHILITRDISRWKYEHVTTNMMARHSPRARARALPYYLFSFYSDVEASNAQPTLKLQSPAGRQTTKSSRFINDVA